MCADGCSARTLAAACRAWILAAACALPVAGVAADAAGTLTILEGDALVYRGAGRLLGAEGLRVQPGDIVETADGALAQVELEDQTVVQLGPSTRVLLQPPAGKGRNERGLYVMNGWVKVTGSRREGNAGGGVETRTPLLDLPASGAVVVLRTTPAEASVFVERGDARLLERQASGAPLAVPLHMGDFYRRKAGTRGATAPSPTQAFVAELPKPFRDSLPMRGERFRDRPAPAREAPDFTYADVEPWLKAEPSVRRPLMQRWRPKARDPAFRAALVANLAAHPEWDPILFPEKYRPKPPPVRAAAAPAPTPAPTPASIPSSAPVAQ